MRKTRALFIAAMVASLAALVESAGAEGSAYARWRNGPSADPKFFPIAVWLQVPRKAPDYKAIGINTYVGLWKGPTEEQLAELTRHGMKVVCSQNDVGLKHRNDPTIIGWMHMDEPDNAQPIGKYWKSVRDIKRAWPDAPDRTLEAWGKWGPCVPPKDVAALYTKMKAADPTRPVLLNLGQGVAWDGWHGRNRSNHPEDYAEYARGADIVSFDVYPMCSQHAATGGKLHLVAHGVSRLRRWTTKEQIVWNALECTPISSPDHRPTPRHVRAEVWMSLIHGSRGIIYFVHVMGPRFIEAGLLADREMSAAVAQINRQIHALAPVLNDPTLEDAVTVKADPPGVSADLAGTVGGGPVAVMVKKHAGATYLFAVRMEDRPAKATFTLKPAPRAATVEVIDEDRRLPLSRGAFTDDFKPYDVHLYRIADAGR